MSVTATALTLHVGGRLTGLSTNVDAPTYWANRRPQWVVTNVSERSVTREGDFDMGVGVSLLLIAAGAILKFAVTVSNSHGVDWNTVGVILMVIGGIGLLASLLMWGSWGGVHRRRTTYVDDGPVV
jgi:hypothetical protein